MDETQNLKLPYIVAAQAQKHVTHNEALRALDAIVQLMVLDKDLSAPPGSPAEGVRYIVAASPTGAWTGKAGKIAAYQDGAWAFYAPLEGWLAWVTDENTLYAFDGSAWGVLSGGSASVNPTPLVGVNATADTTNRLAVASPASLFNHDGAGHQVKINKAAPADTASLLFQTAFSGRAEYGLAGDDDFHVKVSPDGSTWHEAIIVDKDTGEVSFPNTSIGGGGGGITGLVEDTSPQLGGNLDLNGFHIAGLVPGTNVQAWDADLDSLAALASTGFPARTAANTWTQRSLLAPAAGITISNGDGVAGNPTLALANDLAALEALSGTNTLYYRSGADAWSAVTIGGLLSFSGGTLNVGDAELAAIAGLSSAADKGLHFTGAGAAATHDLTSFARALLDDADAPAACATLGVGIRKLSSGTLTNAAQLDIVLPTGYTDFELRLANFVPATDGVQLWLRTSDDGGSSFEAGSTDYSGAVSFPFPSGTSSATVGHIGGLQLSAMLLFNVVGNEADEGCSAVIAVQDPRDAAIMTRIQVAGSLTFNSGTVGGAAGAGRREVAEANDAIRILFSSGNIASGKWALYGYA